MLYKRTVVVGGKHWKRRFFVLDSQGLFYYYSQKVGQLVLWSSLQLSVLLLLTKGRQMRVCSCLDSQGLFYCSLRQASVCLSSKCCQLTFFLVKGTQMQLDTGQGLVCTPGPETLLAVTGRRGGKHRRPLLVRQLRPVKTISVLPVLFCPVHVPKLTVHSHTLIQFGQRPLQRSTIAFSNFPFSSYVLPSQDSLINRILPLFPPTLASFPLFPLPPPFARHLLINYISLPSPPPPPHPLPRTR